MALFETGPQFLVSLAVNSATGELTEVDHAHSNPDALGGYIIRDLAITPDSPYVVTVSGMLSGIAQTFLVFRIEDGEEDPRNGRALAVLFRTSWTRPPSGGSAKSFRLDWTDRRT